MDKIELVQKIGNEVCEDCSQDADCGIDPKECFRIQNAIKMLDDFSIKMFDFQCCSKDIATNWPR